MLDLWKTMVIIDTGNETLTLLDKDGMSVTDIMKYQQLIPLCKHSCIQAFNYLQKLHLTTWKITKMVVSTSYNFLFLKYGIDIIVHYLKQWDF